MYRCEHCGAEFDGKFCPECGQKREEKLFCSECGNEVSSGMKFCNNCGHALPAGAGVTAKAENSVNAGTASEGGRAEMPTSRVAAQASVFEKLHLVCKYLPAALFSLFAVLLLAFYAADVALFDPIDKSFGSVYVDITVYIPEIKGCVAALAVFTVTAFVLAALMWIFLFAPQLKTKSVSLFGKAFVLVNELFEYIAFAVYFIFFVIAIAMMVTVSAFDDGAGTVTTGAAPKLILSFAVIFAAFAAVALICDCAICKRFPQAVAADKALREQSIADKKARREQMRLQKTGQEQTAVNAPNVDYARDESRENDGEYVTTCYAGKPIMCKIKNYVKSHRALLGVGIANFFLTISLYMLMYVRYDLFGKDIILYIMLGIAGLFVLLVTVCALSPVRYWEPSELRKLSKEATRGGASIKRGRTTVFYILCLILNGVFLLLGLLSGIFNAKENTLITSLFLILFIAGATLFDIAGIIACTVLGAKRKELALYFYGNEKPDMNATQIIPFDFEKEMSLYVKYENNKSVVSNLASTGAQSKFAGRRFFEALCITCIAAVMISFPFAFNPFSASSLSSADETWGKQDVICFFGKPDVEQTVQDKTVLMYYDGEMASTAKQINKLNEDMQDAVTQGNFDAIEPIAELLQRLENKVRSKKFKATVFQFTKYSFDYVCYDTATTVNNAHEKKTVKSVEICGPDILCGTTPSNLYCKYYYADGSYRFEALPTTVFDGIDNTKEGKQKIEWSDDWGQYAADISLHSSLSGKDDGISYTASYDKNTDKISMKISGTNVDYVEYNNEFLNYAPYVTDLTVDVTLKDNRHRISLGFESDVLQNLIVTARTSPLYISEKFDNLENIWIEATYESVQQNDLWTIPYKYSDKVHYGDTWSYVNGVPTLKDGVYTAGTWSGSADYPVDYLSDIGEIEQGTKHIDITLKLDNNGKYEMLFDKTSSYSGSYVISDGKIYLIDDGIDIRISNDDLIYTHTYYKGNLQIIDGILTEIHGDEYLRELDITLYKTSESADFGNGSDNGEDGNKV